MSIEAENATTSSVSSDFEKRILMMLEGAAFAILEDKINQRVKEAIAVETSYRMSQAQQAADQILKNAKQFQENVRSRVKIAEQQKLYYEKLLEEVHERISELCEATDSGGIANELSAILEMIDNASRKD